MNFDNGLQAAFPELTEDLPDDRPTDETQAPDPEDGRPQQNRERTVDLGKTLENILEDLDALRLGIRTMSRASAAYEQAADIRLTEKNVRFSFPAIRSFNDSLIIITGGILCEIVYMDVVFRRLFGVNAFKRTVVRIKRLQGSLRKLSRFLAANNSTVRTRRGRFISVFQYSKSLSDSVNGIKKSLRIEAGNIKNKIMIQ